MAGEKTTIARPYAEAVFSLAEQSGTLDQWSEMLELLASIAGDAKVAEIIEDPNFASEQIAALLLDVAEDSLNTEGANLLRVLAENDRLAFLPEIRELFETRKSESQGSMEVHVASAYALQAAETRALAEALSKKLGKVVNITSEKDPSLIGGAVIRAGDLVIDGSVRGRLAQLAGELEI